MRCVFIHSAMMDTGAWATQRTEVISLAEENFRGTLEGEVVILDDDYDDEVILIISVVIYIMFIIIIIINYLCMVVLNLL